MKQLIRKILKEESSRQENLKKLLKQQVKEDGWEFAADLVGGPEDLAKLAFNNDPMDFLNLFNDMNGVKSEANPNWTLFKDDPEKTMISYNRKKRMVLVNFRDIWNILYHDFEIKNDMKVIKLISKWLDEVYNLRDVEILRGKAAYEYLTDEI
jgi:hypothetical protein